MEETTNQIIQIPQLDLPYYLHQISDFFISYYPTMFDGAKSIIGFLIGLSIPVSVMLFVGIVISVEKLKLIRKKEDLILSAKVDMGYGDKAVLKVDEVMSSGSVPESVMKGNSQVTKKWESVIKHVESASPNDWRQAVIEADIILGEILTDLGYRGDGIGEQLRRVEKGDFRTIDSAWEAHKVRNELAHSGSDYPFSQHDARKAVHQYKKVFEEFFYV